MAAQLRCFTCPTRAVCPQGGAVMVPQPGAWHSGPGSTAMLSCVNPASCRAGNKTAQEDLVMCQAAWWSTHPPGLNPHRLPDGRLCVMDDARSQLPFASNNTFVGRSLAQAHPTHPTGWNGREVVAYTDLQCVQRTMGPLCGACEPGTYATSKRECVACTESPGYHAGIGFLMTFINMLLVLVIGE